jgi:TRAP-type C4-dicarboxylate transport system permease small subunit
MYERILYFVTLGTKAVVTTLGACLILVVAGEVFFRYVLQHPLFFANELARFLFVWTSFLATSIALRGGRHIALELNFLARAWPVRLIALCLVMVFLLIFLTFSVVLLPSVWDRYTTSLGIRVFWAFLALPIGSLLMALQLVPLITRAYQGDRGAGPATEDGSGAAT